MSGTEVGNLLIEKEKEYHERLKTIAIDFTHLMNVKDVELAKLTQALKEANDKILELI